MGAIAGGLIGNEAGSGYQNRASGYLQDASNLFGRIEVPGIEEQELNLLLPEYMGDFTAQQEQALSMDPSAMEGISTDPRLQEAQMGALAQLSEMGETGLLPGERAALNQARRAAASEAQAKSAQLQDEFARRGMGGAGSELAARLQAAQSSGDRLSQENDRTMQMAQERALGAIGQSANLAGQIRGQQFGEQSDVAKAQDAINQFNTSNQQSVQQRNVANTNTAGLRNISEKQRIGEAGTQTKNAQQQHNKGLIQQQFQNQIAKANPQAQVMGQQASSNLQRGQNLANSYAQMGQASDKAVASLFGGAMLSDVRQKKNIKEFDTKSFLDQLDGIEFEYKDKQNGEGKKIGILAQDLEKVLPDAVVDGPQGKEINISELAGPMMANLAELNKRLRKLEGDEG